MDSFTFRKAILLFLVQHDFERIKTESNAKNKNGYAMLSQKECASHVEYQVDTNLKFDKYSPVINKAVSLVPLRSLTPNGKFPPCYLCSNAVH